MPISLANRNWLLWRDDYLVDTKTGVTYEARQAIKRGAVIAPARLWEVGRLGPTGTVVAHSDTIDGTSYAYRMFYGVTTEILSPARRLMAYAVSNNGRHWVRPNLGVASFRGFGTANNLIGITGNKWALSDVLRDTITGVPSGEVYKALSAAPLVADGNGFRLQLSANGKTWTNNSVDALSDVIADGQPQLFYEYANDQYRCFMRGWTNVATPKRGVVQFVIPKASILASWNSVAPAKWWWASFAGGEYVFTASPTVMPIPANPHDVYFSGCTLLDDGYTGYLAFPSMYSRLDLGGTDQVHLAAALSRDGATFTYADGDGITTPAVPVGTNREMDSGTLYAFSGIVTLGGNSIMYYGADNTKHGGGTLPPGQPYQSAICSAEWRQDGFVACRFDDAGGEILTKQVTFTGTTALKVQADAASGQLKVALCDASGVALSGFGFDDCAAIVSNGQHTVTWAGGSIAPYAYATVRLRFQGSRANLYSLQFS